MSGPGLNLVGQEEIDEVLEVLRSGFLYRYGPDADPAFKAKVRTLEDQVARRLGTRYAVAVNSGTSASASSSRGWPSARATRSSCRALPTSPASQPSSTPARCP